MENFYYFDKSNQNYILRSEYMHCTIKLNYTFINKEYSDFWRKIENKILYPDNNGVFLNLKVPYFAHHPVIGFYFELYENKGYSNDIIRYSHAFEMFDIYSNENGFLIYYQQENTMHEPYILFNRDFSKNILCWFGNDDNITKKLSLGLSNELTLDNHIHTTNLKLTEVSNYLYNKSYFENYQNKYFGWKFSIHLPIIASESSNLLYSASGEISRKNNKNFIYLYVPVKNITNAIIIQRKDLLSLNIFRLKHKPYYKNPLQLLISSKENNIDNNLNTCCVYCDQNKTISSFNLKKFSDYKFIIISHLSDEKTIINNFKEDLISDKTYNLNNSITISIFIIRDLESFSYKGKVYTIKGFVNNPYHNVCLI